MILQHPELRLVSATPEENSDKLEILQAKLTLWKALVIYGLYKEQERYKEAEELLNKAL